MIWQTKEWQNMLQASSQTEAFYEIEGTFVEKRKISLGQYGLFVVGTTQENIPYDALKELCKKESCLFVQVESYSLYPSPLLGGRLGGGQETGKNPPQSPFIKGGSNKEGYKVGHYKKFIPPYTAVIDLSQSQEDILARMKPKGRYNIRLAEKKGVKCERVEKTPENIDTFYELLTQTTTRDGFAGNTENYYANFLALLNSELFFASYEESVIAAGIFVFDTEVSLYYYGASGNHHRNLMAPYLLQWKAISHAKEQGSLYYDFLGVADPSNSSDPLQSVTDFKKKFTSDIRQVSESMIWISSPLKYFFIQLLKKIAR
ncbi:peptidoglycan bridge formation glycyltransferase FemA/FemB family protein [Candidatus Gracilibacteria bacterium]|nr:peptidoglycan bridge formation glycyltransferase FemA/FemB family protein [Candidatus Gracilibacteria bacterium]